MYANCEKMIGFELMLCISRNKMDDDYIQRIATKNCNKQPFIQSLSIYESAQRRNSLVYC